MIVFFNLVDVLNGRKNTLHLGETSLNAPLSFIFKYYIHNKILRTFI